MIAEEVRKQQILGMWDYSSFVVMPTYSASADGKELVGEDRKNPINKDAYYPFLLRYYNLDADTKIIFSDDRALQIIKIINYDGTAYLYANSLHKYEYVAYKFEIMEERETEDDEDMEPIVIAESDWSMENTWPIPENCLHNKNKNLKYRCYVARNGDILKEVEGNAIPWQEELP